MAKRARNKDTAQESFDWSAFGRASQEGTQDMSTASASAKKPTSLVDYSHPHTARPRRHTHRLGESEGDGHRDAARDHPVGERNSHRVPEHQPHLEPLEARHRPAHVGVVEGVFLVGANAGAQRPLAKDPDDRFATAGEFARELKVPTPMFAATVPIYKKAMKTGHADEDTASVCAVLEAMAGIKR